MSYHIGYNIDKITKCKLGVISELKGIHFESYARNTLEDALQKEIEASKDVREKVEKKLMEPEDYNTRLLQYTGTEDHLMMTTQGELYRKDEYKCPVCGIQILSSDKFCHDCGLKINWLEDEDQTENEKKNNPIVKSIKNFFVKSEDNVYKSSPKDLYNKLIGTFDNVPTGFPDKPESLAIEMFDLEDILREFGITVTPWVDMDDKIQKLAVSDQNFYPKAKRDELTFISGEDLFKDQWTFYRDLDVYKRYKKAVFWMPYIEFLPDAQRKSMEYKWFHPEM